MKFKEFVHEYNLRKKAKSNIKMEQVLSSLNLNALKIYLRDGPFSSDIRLVHLHPFRGSHWVVYINDFFFDSYGCAPFRSYLNLL